MPKRAERRHHEERVKEKFRRIIKNLWIMPSNLVGWAKMKRIEYEAVRAAQHSKCDCQACHGDRYRKHRHREKVLDKKYIDESKERGNDEREG